MYERIIGRLYDSPLYLAEAKADSIAAAVTRSLFSGQLQQNDFDAEAAPTVIASLDSSKSASEAVKQKVGVIYVVDALAARAAPGASLGGVTYAGINRQIDGAVQEGFTKIGFVFHTPGGEAHGMAALVSRIANLKNEGIETFGYVEGMAASAGYGIASAVDTLYVTETSTVGSIGTIMIHADETAKDEKDGVKYTILRSKAEKALGSPHEELSEKAIAQATKTLATFDEAFNSQVVQNREALNLETVINLKGATVQGTESVKLGLADKVVNNFEEVLQLELKQKSSSPTNSKGTRMSEQKNDTPKPEQDAGDTGITQDAVDTAVAQAVESERTRVAAIMESATALKISAEQVTKYIQKGWEAEVVSEIFTDLAEAKQPSIDSTAATSGVTDENGNDTASRVESTLAAYGAATGQTFNS